MDVVAVHFESVIFAALAALATQATQATQAMRHMGYDYHGSKSRCPRMFWAMKRCRRRMGQMSGGDGRRNDNRENTLESDGEYLDFLAKLAEVCRTGLLLACNASH